MIHLLREYIIINKEYNKLFQAIIKILLCITSKK